jgi:ankyrin repeat protein
MKTRRISMIVAWWLAVMSVLALLPRAGVAGATTTLDQQLIQAAALGYVPLVRIKGEADRNDPLLACGTNGNGQGSFTLADGQVCKRWQNGSRDVGVRLDKTSLVFDESNLMKGEVINVDNKSGLDQTLGLELPRHGLFYSQVLRKPEQSKVPRQDWKRFTVPANSGIFIILIPSKDSEQVERLDGEQVLIKLYKANRVRQTRRIDIKVDIAQRIRARGSARRAAPFPDKQKPGYRPSCPAVIEAAQEADLPRLRQLLLQGADANTRDKDGRTPLMRAAEQGHLEVAKFLLERGADVNAKQADGGTALMSAASNDHLTAAALLIEHGAEVNAATDDGWTAVMMAASQGHLNMVKLLTERGADVNSKADERGTALMDAADRGDLEMVKLLVNSGANVNARGYINQTALMGAAGAGHLEAVKLLLDKGADINAENELGATALIWAAGQGHLEVVKLLLEKGADVNARNDGGYTALSIASHEGRKDVVELLRARGAKE